MKCPNCNVDKDYIIEPNFRFKKQYQRGNGYLKCLHCGEIITNKNFIKEVMNDYYE